MQTVPMITLRKGILPSHLMLLLLCFLIDGKIYYIIILLVSGTSVVVGFYSTERDIWSPAL